MNRHSTNLAPIGISTYSRLKHLEQTIEALKRNSLAQSSELFVFSDAPKPGDEAKVTSIRAYLDSITGFKEITIIKRGSNDRVANCRGGTQQLLDNHGKAILLEEDIVTAPGFLCYMNEALEFYKDAPNILSISGYAPPIPIAVKDDIFVLPRFTAWGFAITKEKYKRIKKIPPQAIKLIDRKQMSRYGDDIYDMVCREALGKLQAGDVRAMYAQYLDGSYTVYPRLSLVQNIGHDGTGLHCKSSTRFTHESLWQKKDGFQFVSNPSINIEIVIANQIFRRKKRKIISTIKKHLGYYYLRDALRGFFKLITNHTKHK